DTTAPISHLALLPDNFHSIGEGSSLLGKKGLYFVHHITNATGKSIRIGSGLGLLSGAHVSEVHRKLVFVHYDVDTTRKTQVIFHPLPLYLSKPAPRMKRPAPCGAGLSLLIAASRLRPARRSACRR